MTKVEVHMHGYLRVIYYAPITLMPRLVMGGNYEGGLTPAACPLGRTFTYSYMGNFYCTCAHFV